MRSLLAAVMVFAMLRLLAECVQPAMPGEEPASPPAAQADLAPIGEPDPEPAPHPLPNFVPDLFRAVAYADPVFLEQLLDEGADANAVLPSPAPADLLKKFRDDDLVYFFTVEKGLTPLMLASAMGSTDIVKLLLERGAKRSAATKKHKTTALWLAGHYGHVEAMQLLLGVDPESETGRTKIHISLGDQMAWFWRGGKVVRTMKVSTGRKQLPTPKGRFVVTDKYKEWKSTLYPAKMPYFLRLSCRDFGMHAGVVPGYPASHGCIRLPADDAKALFAEVPVGTLVEID